MVFWKVWFRLNNSCITFLLLSCSGVINGIDLETRAQDFVLETKKIEIPEHPYAFNPSIVSWRGSLLLSFRELPLPESAFPCPIQSSSISNIGLIFLFDDFTLDGEPYMLELPGCIVDGEKVSRSEDARLITIDERLYILYSDNVNEVVTEGGFRMFIGELDYDGSRFFLRSLEAITEFPGESSSIREKNWVPFDYHDHLLLSYYIQPHSIFRPYLDGSSTAELFSYSFSSIHWKWGELRGGTPALRCGNEYLAFFHSCIETATAHSNGIEMLHYFIGAYTFQKDPPFSLTRISEEPIIGKSFYNGLNYAYYWKPVRVVFPCGYFFDNEYICLFFGRQDHEIWVAKIDKAGLLSSLKPL